MLIKFLIHEVRDLNQLAPEHTHDISRPNNLKKIYTKILLTRSWTWIRGFSL